MSDVLSSVELSRVQPSPRRLRDFGLLVGCAFALLGALLLPRTRGVVMLVLGAVLIVAGLVRPSALHYLYRGWMKLAELLSAIVTPVVLGIMFFGVFTPIGLLRRVLGKDEFFRHARDEQTSWDAYTPRQQRRDHFRKMY